MTSVDWKREGFAAGSKTDELDWNDWKSPLISRLKAKLFRKRTYYMWEDDRGGKTGVTLVLSSILQYWTRRGVCPLEVIVRCYQHLQYCRWISRDRNGNSWTDLRSQVRRSRCHRLVLLTSKHPLKLSSQLYTVRGVETIRQYLWYALHYLQMMYREGDSRKNFCQRIAVPWMIRP